MGLSSGKLILNPVDGSSKTTATVEPNMFSASKGSASQLVNGEASAVNDVPAIDEVVEEPAPKQHIQHTQSAAEKSSEPVPEVTLHGDQAANGPNGTVHTSESSIGVERGRKKSEAFRQFFKRLSAKKSTRKHTDTKPEEHALDADSQESPPGATASDQTHHTEHTTKIESSPAPTAELTEVASSLVQEALSSAVTSNMQDPATMTEVIPVSVTNPDDIVQSQQSIHEETSEKQAHELPTLSLSEVKSFELDVARPCATPLDHVADDETPKENEMVSIEEPPVVDTNNTNSVEEHKEGVAESHTVPQPQVLSDDVTITTKMVSLDLTDEHQASHINGDDKVDGPCMIETAVHEL